jgi:hypothetical protein
MTKKTQLKTENLDIILNQEEIKKYLKSIIKEIYKNPLREENIKTDKILREIYSPEILSKVITDIVFESGGNN